MAKAVLRAEYHTDEVAFEIIYTPEFVNIHMGTPEAECFIVLHPKDAWKLLGELRESLKDLNGG